MIKDIYVKTGKGSKEKLSEILGKEEGPRKQTMIQLRDMEFLLGLLKSEIREKQSSLNIEAGQCYCHTINYEGREFFNITGSKISYNKNQNTFITKTHHSK